MLCAKENWIRHSIKNTILRRGRLLKSQKYFHIQEKHQPIILLKGKHAGPGCLPHVKSEPLTIFFYENKYVQ